MARKHRSAKKRTKRKKKARRGRPPNPWRVVGYRGMEELRQQLGDEAFESMLQRVQRVREYKAQNRTPLYEEYVRVLLDVARTTAVRGSDTQPEGGDQSRA
jgi:hypothetical protein